MAEGPADVCVCVLFYGHDDYCFQLAQRVLNQPMRELAKQNVEFRFGCNAVGPATRDFIREQVALFFPRASVIDSAENAHKYPMMRRLFHDQPLTAPITMWFDDDSCFAPDTDVVKWLPRIQRQLIAPTVLGSVYTTRLTDKQIDWVQQQSWYNGKLPQPYVKFVLGSWWATRSDILTRFDWPPPFKTRRGADVMLGELCRQHNFTLAHFRDGVRINANSAGVEFAGSKRGGQEAPIGADVA